MSDDFKGHFVHVSYHAWMLQDEVRTAALKAMVADLVRPGDVVADVGAGTGILGAWALRGGASKVYAIEASPIARLAQRFFDANGFGDRVVVLEEDAGTVQLPEKVDVVISECLGNFAFSDAMFHTVGRFADRWLKPGGRRGPQRVRLTLQPADGRLFADPTTFFRNRYDDLDVSAFIHAAERRLEVCDALPPFLRAEPTVVAEFDPLSRPDSLTLEADWALPPGKWISGVVGWFDVDWAPTAPMSTSPHAPSTHWSQTLFHVPLHKPGMGERLSIRVDVSFRDDEVPRYRWSGAVTGPSGAVLKHFNRDSNDLFTPE